MNYPLIWMVPAFLGLGQDDTVALGLCLVALFLVAALAVLPSGARRLDAVVYGAALCSPAVMLGVERGNVDLLIFALLALAALLLRRSERSASTHALILFAAVLKLYPIFAAAVLVRRSRSRRGLIGLAAVLALFELYCLAILGEIRTIVRVTPQAQVWSYGIHLFSEWVAAALSSLGQDLGAGALHKTPLGVLEIGLIALCVVLVVAARARLQAGLAVEAAPSMRRDLDLFVVGASVYVGTYVLFRNWDYRLVFLLLTLPQLLHWSRRGSALAITALVALFGTLWLDESLSYGVPVLGRLLAAWARLSRSALFGTPLSLAVLAQFILFAGLSACLVAVAPVVRQRPRHLDQQVALA